MPQVTSDVLLQSTIILIPLSCLPAYIAKKKGRSFWLWYLYAFGFFIFALIHSLMLMPKKAEQPEKSIKEFAIPSEFTVNKCRINYGFIGCPLDTLSYEVLKNPDAKKMTIRLNLFAEKPVKAFDVTLDLQDTMNNPITNKTFNNVNFAESVDLDASQYPYTTYVNFLIDRVYLENGEEWIREGEPLEYNIEVLDGNELDKLRQLTNKQAICLPYQTEDYWVCSCAKANNTDTCVLCNMDKQTLFTNVDKDTVLNLKNDLIRRNNLRQFNTARTVTVSGE